MSVALSSITGDSYFKSSDEQCEEAELDAPIAITLFGRENETEQLLSSYRQISDEAAAKIVLVHGESGSGKTALIDTIRQPVCETNGFVCAGKFFQNSGGIQEPYSAIMAAFSDLCDLVIQSDDFDDSRRSQIQHDLGSDGRLLAKAITNMAPFLDESIEEETHNESAFARFKVACKTFLHTMSSAKHPIVLFIDDIQWADDGSRELIRMLLIDSELKNVMLILAYREEEAASVSDMICDIVDMSVIVDVALCNLESDGIQQLIGSMLESTDLNQMKELSDLVGLKTRGNPFHIIHFMEIILQEKFLVFDEATLSWVFDVDQIQSEIMVSDTVAGLLAIKVRRLNEQVTETLKIASFVGFRFQESVVLEVASRMHGNHHFHDSDLSKQTAGTSSVVSSVSSSLAEAVEGGFIEKTKDGYQFSHDKLQALFQSMFDAQEEEELHLAIGEAHLDIGEAEAVYCSAVHLHCAPAFACDEEHCLILSQVNLDAAKYCKEKSAFADAAILLRRGLDLLDPHTMWKDHYTLAFEMTELLAKMELILGNLDTCKEMTSEVLARATTLEMKINSLLMDMEVRMTGNEMNGAIEAASRSLKVLGIKMPRKIGFRHVAMKLLNVKRLIGRKTDEEILNMPRMQDRAVATAMKLLLHLSTYCLLQDAKHPAVFSALLAAQLTLHHGLSPHSSSALTVYGVAELSSGNHARAYRFGKLALRLHDQIKCKAADGLTTGMSLTLLTHWKEPLREMPDKLHEAMSSAFSVGDVVYGTYCLSMLYRIQTLVGTNLESLEDFMRVSYQRVKDLNRQEAMRMWAQPLIQYVLNLRKSGVTDWRELTSLTGEMMNEAQYMRDAIETNHSILIMIAWSRKAQLACLFGCWALSESVYRDMSTMGPAFHMSYAVVPSSFFAAIASYSRYQETGNNKHLKVAQSYKKKLQFVVSKGNPNAIPYMAVLDAEELSTRKSPSHESISVAYAKGIDAMATANVVHMEAFAHERAGFYYARHGSRSEAVDNFNRAMDLYLYEWGAIAKYEWLAEKSEKALGHLKNDTKGEEEVVGGMIGFGLSDILENSKEDVSLNVE